MQPQVPFAIDAACVARLFQHFGQEDFAGVHAADAFEGHRVFGGRVLLAIVGRLVANHIVDAVTLWVPSGQQATAAWRASWPRDVEAGQLDAPLRQFVEMRRADLLAAKTSQIAKALIIADNQQNVWRLGLYIRADCRR